MNGLQIIDLNEATFMDKLLKREPRENAFVRINNLLSCVPLLRISRREIDDCLAEYEISHEKAKSRLVNFYSVILRDFVGNMKISQSQLEQLLHLQHIFSLDNQEVAPINSAILYPLYRNFIRRAISDGELTGEQSRQIRKLSEQLGIPKNIAGNLYKQEADNFLQSVFNQTLADGMLSAEEERELERISKNLGAELKLSQDAKANLERCRYLRQLHGGNLPAFNAPFRLENGETCHAFVKATHFELRKVAQPVKFSGYDYYNGIPSANFQTGNLQNRMISSNILRYVDGGILYFTSRRFVFVGMLRTTKCPLRRVIGGTFYTDGILVEQDAGNDQFFKFVGDIEALRLIFNRLMTNSRN